MEILFGNLIDAQNHAFATNKVVALKWAEQLSIYDYWLRIAALDMKKESQKDIKLN